MSTLTQDSATKATGQQVITCVACIHKSINGKPYVLVARRAATKKFLPNFVELPGGHIDFGEDLKVGLKREVKEELGVDIKVGDPFGAFTYVNEIKGSHSVEIAYFATLLSDDEPVPNPDDHSAIHWLSVDDLGLLVEANGADDAELPLVRTALALLGGGYPDFGN